MLTAPCSLSASMSKTVFLYWIFNSLSSRFNLFITEIVQILMHSLISQRCTALLVKAN
jgi:hypothetical protein